MWFFTGDIGKLLASYGVMDGATHDVIILFSDEDAKANYEEQKPKIEDYFAAVEKTVTTDEERGYYDSAYQSYQQYIKEAEKLMGKITSSDTAVIQQVQEKMIDDLDLIYNQTYQSLTGLMECNVSTGNILSTKLTANAWIIICSVVGIIVAAAVISISLGIKIAKGIAEPVEALGNIIRDEEYLLAEMAAGNFDVSTASEDYYVGDMAPVLMSLNGIINKLSEIQESSGQVTLASEQLAQGAPADITGGAE